MVGSAIVRELERQGYHNLVLRTHKELDLTRQDQVEKFFEEEKPEYVFLAAAKVGGIMGNAKAKADFMYDNMILEMNVMSGTGIGSFFVMLCYVVFIHRSKLRSKLINMKTLLVAYFGCTMLIVYAGMIPPLRNIIQDVLHKDITFSGRTYIWEMCIKMIARHPLAGYGNFDSGWIIKWNGIMRNAHNLFFDILIQGGIILFAGYLVFLLTVFITASDKENKKSQLILVLLFCLFVVMLCESFLDNNYIFFAYSLALVIKYKYQDKQDIFKLLKKKLKPKAR